MANILLVEDDSLIRELVSLRLLIRGHIVEKAENGKIGYDKIKQSSYDLVLLDLHMPVMSGKELIKILRAENYKGIVVALTADDLTSQDGIVGDHACNGIIHKPIIEGFEEQVEAFLGNL